jgi:hypothetical protein
VLKGLGRYQRVLNYTILDIRKLITSIRAFPQYLADYRRFASVNERTTWPSRFFPILTDRSSAAGSLGEYFWQDLFVARQIIEQNPKRHIDVGSRIDGFIAHLACVRKVEVFDIRPLRASIENVNFVEWDITNPKTHNSGVADCVSCLHTLEHIGLGRYGDEIDPDGWKKGLASLASLLSVDGCFWLSVPCGIQRVEFNANRIFHPRTIVDEAKNNGMILKLFLYLDSNAIKVSTDVFFDIDTIAKMPYRLCIFQFVKMGVSQPQTQSS